jgi:hypothetical protein
MFVPHRKYTDGTPLPVSGGVEIEIFFTLELDRLML